MQCRLNARRVWSHVGLVLFATILSLVVFSAPAYAQLAGASLSGVVQDTSHAAVPNATVTITNTGNGTVRQLTTNADGLYSAPNLLPGSYEVKVEANGFATSVQKGISLTVGAVVPLDIVLKVGQLAQIVEVSTEVTHIETTSSALSGTIEQKVVADLPLNGRDWTALAALTPGISAVSTQQGTNGTANKAQRGFGNQLSDSGHRPNENTYRVDGISVNDYTNGAPGSVLGNMLGVDAVQEFNVVTTNYTAVYGRTSGAVINAITKSGTNQFHGDAFLFYRSQAFDARNPFDPVAIPPFQQKQFGATAGGPIFKDKTFIFGGYEAVRQRLSPSAVNNIPSTQARLGNMCSIPIATGINACTPHHITIDPLVAPYLALWPAPSTVTTTPVGGPNDNGDVVQWATSGIRDSNENFYTFRGDQVISSHDSLALTFSNDTSPQNVPDNLNNLVNKEVSNRLIAGVTETHIFGSKLVNVARIGYNRGAGEANTPGYAINPAVVDPKLFIQNQPNVGGPPQLLFGGGTIQTAGGLGISHWRHFFNSYQAYDDVSMTHGVHSLAFGFAFERLQYYVGNGGIVENQNNGSFTFNATTAGGVTTSSLENFLLDRPFSGGGNPNAAAISLGKRVEPRSSVIGGYAQDDWRFRSNLTLNLGLRYEMVTNPTEAHNNFGIPNSFTAPVAAGGCPNVFPNPFTTTAVLGCPNPVQHLFVDNPTLRNFAPRVGFSWDPFRTGKTAVRAGFGIFDILPLPYVYSDGFTSGYPFSLGFSTPSPLPGGGQGLFPNAASLLSKPGVPAVRFVEQSPKRSYTMNWNLNIQRELINGLGLTVGFVGSHTVHNSFTTDNADVVLPTLISGVLTWPTPVGSGTLLNPNVRQIRQVVWDHSASYSGLQAQLKLQPKHGFQGQVSYTYSGCFSGGDAVIFGDPYQNSVGSLQYFNPASRNGPCDFDVRSNLSINYLYAIPAPTSNLALRTLAGGWQIGGVASLKSGVPFTLLTGGDPLGEKGTDPNDYPDRVAGCNPIQGGVHYLNTSCFVLAPLTASGGPRLGNNGRGSLRGPRLVNFDFALLKDTKIPRVSETLDVQLRFEFFNVFNHTNLQAPVNNNTLTSSAFGVINSTSTDSRKVQLGAKVVW
jgi:hypothetical protein